MKNTSFTANRKAIGFIFLIALFFTTSCIKDKCETTRTYVRYNPVYKSLTEIRKFEVLPAQSMKEFGKIWLYGSYLLVNEPKKGVHIFNNSDPANPVALSFISIPGNVDIAVKDNILYADNYIDMLAIDISNPSMPELKTRTQNAFNFYDVSQGNGILVDYDAETVTEVYEDEDCSGGGGGGWFGGGAVMEDMAVSSTKNSSGGGSTPSVGGSMAKFTLYQNYLYILNQGQILPFDIAAPANPKKGTPVYSNWGGETLFPYKDKLFMGATNGMYIYDLANPATPSYMTTFAHANACDPVVVENDIAYVTLRNGTKCNSFANQLEVVDVKDLYNPRLIKIYPMTNPHGLGIDNGTLFLCDGIDGLKVYDATDVNKITDNALGHYEGMETYDVIPYNNVLILTSKNGIYQYDYSDKKNLKLLSKIAI